MGKTIRYPGNACFILVLVFLTSFLMPVQPATAQSTPAFAGICGQVHDESGAGLPASVQAWDSCPDGMIVAETSAAPDGSFCLTVADGNYDLRVVLPGHCPVVEEDIASPSTVSPLIMQAVPQPMITPYLADYWGTNTTHRGSPVIPGDVIVAYDPDGVVCGVAHVAYEGMYVIHVYGDDLGTTPGIDEGAVKGDAVTFYVNCDCPVTAANPWTNHAFYEEDLDFDCIVRQPIPLCAPWILLSFNVAVEDPARAAVLHSIDGRYSQVISSTCEDGAISWDTTRPPSLNDLTEMDFEHAYWLYSNAVGDTLWVSGAPVPPDTPLDLCAGWNAISYLPNEPDALLHAWASMAGEYTFAFGYECGSGAQTYDVYRPADLNDLTCLKPGYGYWVAMNNPATLSYPTSGYSCATPPFYSARPVNLTTDVTPTRRVCDFWSKGSTDGPAPGSAVVARDEQGTICGRAIVGNNGAFMVHVYGDEPATPADEGATEGSRITFFGQDVTYAVAGDASWMHYGSIEITLSAGGTTAPVPGSFALLQNYPNPFNAQTVISFTLPHESDWKLSVYDITGRLVDEFKDYATTGGVTVNWDASGKASGLYFYRLTAGDFAQTKKMTLMK